MGLLDLMRLMSIQRQQDQEHRRRKSKPKLVISTLLLPCFLSHLPSRMPKTSGSGLLGSRKDLVAAQDVPLSLFSWVDV
ncbi:unnamed protein product [Urochloa humidicola]